MTVDYDEATTRATQFLEAYSGELWRDNQVNRSLEVGDAIKGLWAGKSALEDRLSLLCPLLRELVELASEVTPPESCKVGISATPDVYVERPDGHWVGLQRAQAVGAEGTPTKVWVAWRGSMVSATPRFGTLQEVVDHYGTCLP